jgi:hypothetical protein
MSNFKKPRKTFIDHLTHDNYYLNEKVNELYRLTEILQVNNDYLNKSIFSTYDFSGNFKTNIKIIFYDSSNNIISYFCTDNSGNVSPYSMSSDISNNITDMSNDLMKEDTTMKNTILNTESHILDNNKCFPYGYGYHHGYPGYHHGYPRYPHGYPRYHHGYGFNNFRNDDDDDYDRNINLQNFDMSHNPIPITYDPINHYPITYPYQIPKEFMLNNNHHIPNHHYVNH